MMQKLLIAFKALRLFQQDFLLLFKTEKYISLHTFVPGWWWWHDVLSGKLPLSHWSICLRLLTITFTNACADYWSHLLRVQSGVGIIHPPTPSTCNQRRRKGGNGITRKKRYGNQEIKKTRVDKNGTGDPQMEKETHGNLCQCFW